MTYQEMLDSRAERRAAAMVARREWFKNADVEQLERDQQELDEIAALADE